MKKILFILALVCCTCASAGEKVRNSKTTFMHDALKPFVESGQLPGAVSILYNDGVQEVCCIGYADVDKKRPIRLDNVYMQCSQTKGFCGVTVAKLVEQGKMSLDDPVSKYLPEFGTLWVNDGEKDGVRTLHRAKNVLTVRMCLNHTGGFPFETSAKAQYVRGGGWSGGAPLRQNATVAAMSPINFEPGTSILYSNTGIDIAAACVEVVTGMRWEDFLRKEILLPLGMKDTWFWPTDKQLKSHIEMYDAQGDAPAKYCFEADWQQRPYNDGHVFASAGAGLWTTAQDQIKFYKMLMNLGVGDNDVRVLQEETVKSILLRSTRPAGWPGYSLGLDAPENDNESSWVGHGGAWSTYCYFNWHKRQLKLWAVQIHGGTQAWTSAREKAENTFFQATLDNTTLKEYTGRLK